MCVSSEKKIKCIYGSRDREKRRVYSSVEKDDNNKKIDDAWNFDFFRFVLNRDFRVRFA